MVTYLMYYRESDGVADVMRWENAQGCALDPRCDLWSYSKRFSWGTKGNDAAQLSLALLADALGDDSLACLLHVDLKHQFISKQKGACWAVTDRWLKDWALGRCSDLLEDYADLRFALEESNGETS